MTDETYICDSCGNVQVLKSTDPIMCNYCYRRVFRKLRVEKLVQFIAR